MGTKEEAGKARLLYRLVKLFDYFLLGDNKYKKLVHIPPGCHLLMPMSLALTGLNLLPPSSLTLLYVVGV